MNTLTKAAQDVLAERQRQISVEGWDEGHDDHHYNGELAAAAACYASPHRAFKAVRSIGRGYESLTTYRDLWPWRDEWWKPKDRRADLVRAGALILAEIERLDRANLLSLDQVHARIVGVAAAPAPAAPVATLRVTQTEGGLGYDVWLGDGMWSVTQPGDYPLVVASGVDACRVDQFSSRCCERGTKGCTVAHGVPGTPAPEPCPRGEDRPESACTNRHQCWEPCGELGHSAEHARVGRTDPAEVKRILGVPGCYDPPGPRMCDCGHHEGYHNDAGECLQRLRCGCKGLPPEPATSGVKTVDGGQQK